MPSVALDVSVIVVLLLINGVLAMAEIAIVTARSARLESRAAAGSGNARTALSLKQDPTRFLSTIQIGITLVAVLAGAFGGARLAEPLGNQLDRIELIDPYGGIIAVGIVVAIITYFSIVVGELVPKRIALQHPEGVAAFLARPMKLLSSTMSPLVAVLAVSTDTILRLLRIKNVGDEVPTEEEIRLLIEQSSAAGVFEEAERDVIRRAMTLGDHTAGSLMTPRTKTEWIDIEDPPDELWDRIHACKHNYVPIARGSLDDAVGVAALRALLVLEKTPALQSAVLAAANAAHFVPEGASALALLELFKRSGMPVALVVDEYGSIQGIVTVTDVLETLVGDIGPEEASEPGIAERPDGSFLVDGLFSIDEFKERMGLNGELPDEPQFQTVAGFVLSRLGHIPAVTETFSYDGLTFEVVDMDGARIDKVLVTPADKAPATAEAG